MQALRHGTRKKHECRIISMQNGRFTRASLWRQLEPLPAGCTCGPDKPKDAICIVPKSPKTRLPMRAMDAG